MVINLWQIPYLDTGALYPCVFNSCWDVTDGKLNCMLTIRSNDIPLGHPFNVTQYAVFIHLLAQVTNLKPGMLTVCISNAHIYENQVEGMKEQLNKYLFIIILSIVAIVAGAFFVYVAYYRF